MIGAIVPLPSKFTLPLPETVMVEVRKLVLSGPVMVVVPPEKVQLPVKPRPLFRAAVPPLTKSCPPR